MESQPVPDLDFPHQFGSYRYQSTIGRGAYGIVIKAIDHKRDLYAVKVISRSFLQMTNTFFAFEQELRVQQLLKHPNIVGIKEVIYQPDFIFVVMELCTKGDLFTYISEYGPLNTTTVRHIFYQILLAVQYLHKRQIAHLDLKPDNILITDNETAKISDFGCCEAPPKRQVFGAIGTLYYAAPEILEHKYNDNLPADIWSLGIILFAMTAGCLPWLPGTDAEICKQIVQGHLTIPPDLPSNIYKILFKCCQVNRDSRPTIDQLINDPWFDAEKNKSLTRLIAPHVNGSLSLRALTVQKQKVDVRPNHSEVNLTHRISSNKSMPRISTYSSLKNVKSRFILSEAH